MTGSLLPLLLAAAFLLGSHFGLSAPSVRAALVLRIGEGPFRGGFALIALGAVIWLTRSYHAAPVLVWWEPQFWYSLVPILIMPVALVFLVAGLSLPNPTSAGQSLPTDWATAVRGAIRITRHPLMWAIGLWALAHLIASGTAAAVIFFGTLAVLALVGTVLIDAKSAARLGSAWRQFAEVTSLVPFMAILGGRQSFGRAIAEIGAVRLIVAVLLYIGLYYGHGWLFGPPLILPL